MCSQFQVPKTMENYQGDLADIVRGSNGAMIPVGNTTACREPPDGSASAAAVVQQHVTDSSWQFPNSSITYCSGEQPDHDFDPFFNLRDPIFHELDMMPEGCTFFSSNDNNNNNNNNNSNSSSSISINNNNIFGAKIIEDEMKRPASNIFSRMLQISPNNANKLAMSPCDSPSAAAATAAAVGCSSPRVALKSPSAIPILGGGVGGGGVQLVSHDNIISPDSSKGSYGENSGLQISSPRNTGIKRRKSQAKKVVCIPATAPANSRQSGEIVPSDLWAWRKYGQKPIKGSPYPRGYYRCSSSKGCSARKQVERSRTDPNMLVITYTSEHNHPWPTQRNALAGSTRSQASKTPSTTTPKNTQNSLSQSQKSPTNPSLIKDEQEHNDSTKIAPSSSSSCPQVIKEEVLADQEEQHDHHQNVLLEMHDNIRDDQFCTGGNVDTYKPALPDHNNSSSNNHTHAHEDFFADLGEIEADPLNLLFAQAFSSGDHEARLKKGTDHAFNLFDWTGNTNNNNDDNNNNTSTL